MSKASEWAHEVGVYDAEVVRLADALAEKERAQPATLSFPSPNGVWSGAEIVACVSRRGGLLLLHPHANARELSADEALAFFRWGLETFEERP